VAREVRAVIRVLVVIALALVGCERDVILDPRDASNGSDDGLAPDGAFEVPDATTDLDAGNFDAEPQPDGGIDAL